MAVLPLLGVPWQCSLCLVSHISQCQPLSGVTRDGHSNKHHTWAATGDCVPVYGGCKCGLSYSLLFYKKTDAVMTDIFHGHWVTSSLAVWSHGHWQFNSVVTWSRTVFGWSQNVTLVAAQRTAHTGVTTPCVTHTSSCYLPLTWCWTLHITHLYPGVTGLTIITWHRTKSAQTLLNKFLNSQSNSDNFYQSATHEANGWLVLYIFCICLSVGLCVPTHHVCNNYVKHIVVIWPYYSGL